MIEIFGFHDSLYGKTEEDVRKEYGTPTEEERLSFDSMDTTVRRPIKTRMERLGFDLSKDQYIKEARYFRAGHDQLVWLILNDKKQWVCVGDSVYPPGVLYRRIGKRGHPLARRQTRSVRTY